MISISNKKLNFEELNLSGVFKIIKNKFSDDRGDFFRLFCEEEFKDQNIFNNLNQINLSTSARKGTVRGLHYQTSPFSEQKIVTMDISRIISRKLYFNPYTRGICTWISNS